MGRCGDFALDTICNGILRGRAICEKTVDVLEDLG